MDTICEKVMGDVAALSLPMKFVGAGHLVPMDQPAAALNMLNTFIFKGAF